MTNSSLQPPTPIVSVIVPAFNYGHFIAQTINSLRAQTLEDWECIIVDDGSTDDTPSLVNTQARSDSRIRYVRQPNRGQPAARNVGVSAARGRYVQLLDADDLLEPYKFAVHAAFLDAHPDVDIVYGGCRYFPTDRPDERRMSLTDPDAAWMPCLSGSGRAMIRAFLERNIVPINTPLVRRRVFDETGPFDESLARADDWDYWLRCAVGGKRFAYCDDKATLALIRMHRNSLTRRDRRLLPSMRAIFEKVAPALQTDLAMYAMGQLSWLREVESLAKLIDVAVPDDIPFILVDDDKFRGDLSGYPAIPFTEKEGRYNGPPLDGRHGVEEIERFRAQGCQWIVFSNVALWHLEHFTQIGDLLASDAERCADVPEVGTVFRLQEALRPAKRSCTR